MFSLWRIRRTWLRNVIKRCHNSEVRREIFKRLGQVVYSIWDGVDSSVAMEELLEDFVDQITFVEYFRASWVPKMGRLCVLFSHLLFLFFPAVIFLE